MNPPVALPQAGETRPVILLAEDEAIIGFELRDSLALVGFDVAGPFDTCAGAEAWLRAAGRVDGAILDNGLRDGPCQTLARDLKNRGVPFIVHSGHDCLRKTPSVFKDAPWIVKPVPFEALLKSLRSTMAAEGASG